VSAPSIAAPAGDVGGERAPAGWTASDAVGDRVYHTVLTALALCVPLLFAALAWQVAGAAWPALRAFGPRFLTSSTWDPVAGVFGIAPALYGTIVSSLLALALAVPVGVGAAVFLAEFAPAAPRRALSFAIDLLAAVPSVVYGLWGLFVMVPWLRAHAMPFLDDRLGLGAVPLFSGPAYGPSMLAAALILAIMVIPYVAAVSREVLLAVPRAQREAALALGATPWEVVWGVVLPYARRGLAGGVMLGLGRALGETMAVTLVIGNRHELSTSLFAPGYTLASLVANEFSEATGTLHLSALMAAAAVLLALTVAVNAAARWLVWRVRRTERA